MDLFLGVVSVIVGFINVKFPTFFWYITTGWKFQDAEPSDIALGLNKFVGYFLLLVGAAVILDFFFPGLSS